ncbi:MAG: DNA cytosine methyltransferase [Candidatus Binatia bacterium]|nr:DNA cytosine methyltransferase [Candidatus Binatia bacterium]
MRLLDLFCGAGGTAMGYCRAGFTDIVGVDNRPMPRYPFPFVQADALEYLEHHGMEFDVIHASPPCQAYSVTRFLPWLLDREFPRLIDPTRELLTKTDALWIIENVMGAKLAAGWLCGGMFGLPFYRHRAFETNFFWLQPGHPQHRRVSASETVQRSLPRRPRGITDWGNAQSALGIDWMTRDELSQAIPPAYTEWIGKRLLEVVCK